MRYHTQIWKVLGEGRKAENKHKERFCGEILAKYLENKTYHQYNGQHSEKNTIIL